ncbi:MAG: LLM class flavin-dependent oxidoreductase [Myxococcales bacterium]|nr:MAG: LLM class flavin-dependent oxidoreductase [Myxococcales bacterium]
MSSMSSLRFGLHYLLSCAPGQDPQQRYRDTLEQAVRGEALGFESVWPVEHHFNRAISICPSPMLLLAAIAARTSRLRLGTAVIQLPLSHPLRVAEEAAMLDVMSGGRVELGLGRGSNPSHFAGLGVSLAESRERLEEGLTLLSRALTGEPFSFEGAYHRARDITLSPRPLQVPHPRIHLAANGQDTLELAGRRGLPVILAAHVNPLPRLREYVEVYARSRQAAGHPPPRAEDISLLMPIFVAETKAQVDELMAPSVAHYLKLVRTELVPVMERCTVEAERVKLSAMLERMSATRYQDFNGQMGIFDTPQACVEKLSRLKKELGVGRVIGWFNFGGVVPHAAVLRSMELFASEVMPAF